MGRGTRYESPRTGAGISIPAIAANLVYYVTVDDRVIGWDYVVCDGGRVKQIDVRINADTAWTAGVACGY